jgi:hypothetical protein
LINIKLIVALAVVFITSFYLARFSKHYLKSDSILISNPIIDSNSSNSSFKISNSSRGPLVLNNNFFGVFELYETGRKCFIYYDEQSRESAPHYCPIGLAKKTLPPTYFLTGDSLAMSLTFAFDELDGSGLYASIGHDCPPMLIPPGSNLADSRTGRGYRCAVFHKQIYDFIKSNATRINKLFIAGKWKRKLKLQSLDKLIKYTISEYAKIRVTVYFIQSVPEQPVIPLQVYHNLNKQKRLTDAALRNNSVTKVDYLANEKWIQGYFNAIRNGSVDVRYLSIDVMKMCDEFFCSMGTAEQAYYADEVHINAHKARTLKHEFEKYIL